MKKGMVLPIVFSGIAMMLSLVRVGAEGPADRTRQVDAARADALVITKTIEELRQEDVKALPALPVAPFVLPEPGVDVMRVVMDETYDVAGVGVDTVELRGWIAVKHDNARPAEGQTDTRWGTAVMDTEFVGMDLRGESEIFGPVVVSLNSQVRSAGQVGMVAVPEIESIVLAGSNANPKPTPKPKPKPKSCVGSACNCVAAVSANVAMPHLCLDMSTKYPVIFHSIVETIPPVGYTASVSLTPTPLVSQGREVGTLQSARVKFREVVKHASLNGDSGGSDTRHPPIQTTLREYVEQHAAEMEARAQRTAAPSGDQKVGREGADADRSQCHEH